MKRKIVLMFAAVLLLALAPAVLAGGWAVVTLDEPPGEIRAGEPWTLNFTVLQHGKTPVHKLDPTSPVEPLLVARNPATGQRVEVMAQPAKEVGRFVVEVTFPSDGSWEWTIYPNPLVSETTFEPLTVVPALNASAVEESVVEPVAPAIQPDTAPAAAQPLAPSTSTATADAGFPLQAGFRWAALAVAVVAVALWIAQGRRRSALKARVES